jgi:hypothetical protein
MIPTLVSYHHADPASHLHVALLGLAARSNSRVRVRLLSYYKRALGVLNENLIYIYILITYPQPLTTH